MDESRLARQPQAIAIVGVGCRFPGGANRPEQLWRLLEGGTDAIVDVPGDRWETDRFFHADHHQPGRHVLRQAGFVEGVDRFDARFFGISPREAQRMDPQQRFLLEVAYEALEDAGMASDRLAGSNTGVFVGISSNDYHAIQTGAEQVDQIDTHTATGGAMSLAANRLSYVYDLRGPSVSVDTACSSSLVATHLACAAIERGECDLALAGGVNLILVPYFTMCLSQAGMLSPRWRSRAFDASADGYARGEGAGVVVLKPLDAALRDGDHVYAVIRGTAVNQDGRTPGITVPSAQAQRRAIEAACRRAGVAPADVGYVEAHGTGTPVGDPLEAEGLGRGFGVDRDAARPLVVGSIKSNIGHLESAAGIAGLIKAALVVERGEIPRVVHFESPNPRIPMADLGLRVADRTLEFPAGGRRLAGVNSFGFGGTNAHVLIEGPPAPAASGEAPAAPWILPLSARSPEALRQLVAAWASAPLDDAGSLAATAARRRDHHTFRRAFVGASADAMRARLAAVRDEEDTSSAVASTPASPRVVFAFCGQGPQWWAMGRELLDREPAFRAEIERADVIMRRINDWSLLDALRADEESSRMQDTDVLQPALFGIQIGLAALWRSWGIEPAAVIGHSMGEMAAAYVAGILPLEDAARVILFRGRIQARADAAGGMAFVALPPERALAAARAVSAEIAIGAYNSPAACTLSGDRAALETLLARFADEGVFARIVRVNCACHSADMDPFEGELLEVLRGIEARPSTIPFYSTVTGGVLAGPELGARYWWDNFRQPVAFMQAADALLADGFDTFIELAPHPVLVSALRECFTAASRTGVALPSLLREKPERAQMLEALGRLYERGASVDWSGVYPGRVAQRELPRYPWQHESHWTERTASRGVRLGRGDHPLLERRLGVSTPTWETRLDRASLAWVKDHGIMGEVVVPGAAYVEAALAAARVELGSEARLEEVELRRVLILPSHPPRALQVALSPGDRRFTITSRTVGEEDGWVEHAVGRYAAAAPSPARPARDLASIKARCPRAVDVPAMFTALEARGYAYGHAFRGLVEIDCGDHEFLGKVEVPPGLEIDAYGMHPAVLDACLQVMLAQLVAGAGAQTVLPVGFGRVELHAPFTYPLHVHARILGVQREGFTVDLELLAADGKLVAQIIGLRARAVASDARTAADASSHLYAHRWVSRPLPGQSELPPARFVPPPAALVAGVRPHAEAIARELERASWYTHVRPRVDALCATYAARALVALGADFTASHLPTELEAKVVPERRALFRRLLTILAEDGFLTEGGRIVRRPADLDTATETWRELLWAYPDNVAELDLLRRSGDALAPVLTGEVNPLQVLFPDGSLGISAGLYQDAPVTRVYNLLARSIVADIVRRLPEGRTLRVLEIGAGTGGLTTHLASVLPEGRSRYVYSDVSPHFLHAAAERFKDRGIFEYRILDIDRDPAAQEFAPASFDLIVASDAVHATPDLQRSLRHAHSLLAPGGLLLLIEALPPSRMLDVTFGLTDGWWAFADARKTSPLLAPEAWEATLREAGFRATATLAETTAHVPAQAVVLARAAETPERLDEAAPAEPATAPRRWVVGADRGGVGARFAERLRAAGHAVTVVQGVELPLDPMPTDVVGFWALDEQPATAPESLHAGCSEALRAIRQIAAKDHAETPRLWCITAGAHATDETPDLRMAALWGLGSTAVNELPRLRFTLVDLPRGCADAALAALVREAVRPVDDGERALRLGGDGSRLVRRLVRVRPEETLGAVATGGTALRAGLTHRGSADSLALRRVARRPPGPGEIEVEVKITSLNFRDLMVSLGFVPVADREEGDLCPGAEGAGIVTAVGAGVTDLHAGDRVAFLATDGRAIATHVTMPAGHAYPMPDALDFTSAGALSTVYVTALIALREFARVRPGETVLVHAASGGLGLATLQVARYLGVEVFATAGSHEKREFLRALGVEHVMDSRSLDFADEIRALTRGRGVDVVVNCLVGDAMARSLDCLAPYGRFIEVGKRDLLENTRVGLRSFANNIAYLALDVSTVVGDRPAESRALILETMRLVTEGKLHALPSRTYALTEARAALRSLGAARHVGKVLISPVGGGDEERVLPLERRLELRADATYLVTGGLGGFGLATAEWLAARGARHLVLAGRRGTLEPAALERLRAAGAEVTVEAVDVSDGAAVQALVARAHRPERPLRGVFHAAMVLDDVPLLRLDDAQFERVFAPKARGAWHLDVHTRSCPLDHFVLFSSASALVGTPGQGNYVAANAFVDALAVHRRARGLPALAVNWGMLEETGYVARHGAIARRLEAQGMQGFTPTWALSALERFLERGTTQVGVLRMDWRRWLTSGSDSFAANPQFEDLRAEVLAAQADAESEGDGASGPRSFEDRLHAHVARVLGLSPSRLDRSANLAQAGLDSLLGAEISAWIRREAGVELSVMTLMKGVSVASLVAAVERQKHGAQESAARKNPWTSCSHPLAEPRIRLFCLPFLGGGPSAYLAWADAWPDIEVHAIQLPGHEGRITEEPFEQMTPLIEAMADGIRPLLDRPFAIYGHSLGSRMAYELARQIERTFGLTAVALFPAAFQAPARPTAFGDLAEWPDSALAQISDQMILDELHRTLLPETAVTDRSLLAQAMPGIRASVKLHARYLPGDVSKVSCPIHTLVADDDPGVTPEDMTHWGRLTSGASSAETIHGGGHLFLVGRQADVLRAIGRTLGSAG